MNIFGLYTKGAVERTIAKLNRENKLFQSIFKFYGKDTPFSKLDNPQTQLTEGYIGNSTVYSIFNRVISMSSNAKLKLWEKQPDGTRKEVTDHPLLKLVEKPNPYTTQREYTAGWLIYYMGIGNVFQYKLAPKNGINKGIPQQIYIMPSYDVEVMSSGNWMSPIGGYRVNMTEEDFEFEEVQHDKMFNPLYADENEVYGLSPIRVAANKINKSNEADLSESRAFANQGPPYIVSKKGAEGFSETQKRNLAGDYNKRKGGKNSGLPWFTGLNDIQVTMLGVSPADLQTIESSKQTLRDLCNMWGFPVDLMNDPDGSTYNNKKEARKAAWTDCVAPKLDIQAEGLTQFLINQSPLYMDSNLFYAYDYSEVPELQEDFSEKVTWMTQAKWTPNEIREATGKEKIDNELMDQPYFAFSDVPLNQLSEDLTAGPNEEDQKGIDNYK